MRDISSAPIVAERRGRTLPVAALADRLRQGTLTDDGLSSNLLQPELAVFFEITLVFSARHFNGLLALIQMQWPSFRQKAVHTGRLRALLRDYLWLVTLFGFCFREANKVANVLGKKVAAKQNTAVDYFVAPADCLFVV